MATKANQASQTPTDRAIAWFDRAAETYRQGNPHASERLDEFLALLPSGARVLDVGCGPGTDAHYMAARGFDVVGIDAAPGMIDIARRDGPDVQFHVADLRRLPFEPASFDGILASYSIIFIPKQDLAAVVKDVAGLLRPGGILLTVLQGGPSSDVGNPHLFGVMTLEEGVSLVSGAGLEVFRQYRRAPQAHEMPFEKLHVFGRNGATAHGGQRQRFGNSSGSR